MGWSRFDDGYPHHPKMMRAGLDALGFDVAGICYSNRYGTDGWIPDDVLPAVFPGAKQPKNLAQRLVDVGRWERGQGGYRIHDFGEYNPSAEEREQLRRKRAEAGRRGGIKSGQSRSNDVASASSNDEAGAEASAMRGLEANLNPDPPRSRSRPEPKGSEASDPQNEFKNHHEFSSNDVESLSSRLAAACKNSSNGIAKDARRIVSIALNRLVRQEVERLVEWAEKRKPPPDHPAIIWEPLQRRCAEVGATVPKEWKEHPHRSAS